MCALPIWKVCAMEELEKLFRWDILINPDKYKEAIDADKIVADTKVDYEGVERYRRKIAAGEDIGTIVVVKHPERDLYAVLDGHHRYWGARWEGIKEMDCAVIYDLVGLLFALTSEGSLQQKSRDTSASHSQELWII